MSDPRSVHHNVSAPVEMPPSFLFSRNPNKASACYSCGMFSVSKNINHVLSSRMSHPTVLHVSDDWQSCVNNAAVSILTELQPCCPTRCACWWVLFNTILSPLLWKGKHLLLQSSTFKTTSSSKSIFYSSAVLYRLKFHPDVSKEIHLEVRAHLSLILE